MLIAYALDLDPNLNLQNSLPRPVLGEHSLSISFHSTSAGVTYAVQTSTDLNSWTSEGVTLSEINPEGRQTAWVESGAEQQFMRLLMTQK